MAVGHCILTDNARTCAGSGVRLCDGFKTNACITINLYMRLPLMNNKCSRRGCKAELLEVSGWKLSRIKSRKPVIDPGSRFEGMWLDTSLLVFVTSFSYETKASEPEPPVMAVSSRKHHLEASDPRKNPRPMNSHQCPVPRILIHHAQSMKPLHCMLYRIS